MTLNDPLVFNLTNQGSFTVGREIERVEHINGTWLCKCRPIDIQEVEFSSLNPWAKNPNVKKLKEVKEVLVEDNCRQVFVRGKLSPYRDIVFYISPDLKGTEILEQNIKAFTLISQFKSEALQYKAFYDRGIEQIKSIKELGKYLERFSMELASYAYKIAENMEKFKVQEQKPIPAKSE